MLLMSRVIALVATLVGALLPVIAAFSGPLQTGHFCQGSFYNSLHPLRLHRVRLTAKPKSNDPFESFRKGLEGVFGGWEKLGGGYEAFTEVDQLLDEPEQDLEAFRSSLIKQSRSDADKKKQDFTGYDLYDLIVEKWGVPYDVQINKTVFAGKPVLCYNVMWKYLGQRSFNMRKQDYLEHLEALAQLLKKWDRVDHFKQMLKESKKKPDAYFGYAVALPLDLPPDTLVDYFDDSYF